MSNLGQGTEAPQGFLSLHCTIDESKWIKNKPYNKYNR